MNSSDIERVRQIARESAREEFQSLLGGLVLQNGGGIVISGGGLNWTISLAEQAWTGSGICNGDGTITINMRRG